MTRELQTRRTNMVRLYPASTMAATMLFTVASAIAMARVAHADDQCKSVFGIEFCSATTNRTTDGILVGKNWCGDSEISSTLCANDNEYDVLSPGESTRAHQDWDAF